MNLDEIRQLVLAQMKELKLSQYAIVKKLKKDVSETSVYDFLSGRSGINLEALGLILDIVELQIIVKKKGK